MKQLPGVVLGSACLLGLIIGCVLLGSLAGAQEPVPWERGTIDPDWADRRPTRELHVRCAPDRSAAENGANLLQTLRGLQAGDRLLIGHGTYSIDSKVSLDLQGTPQAPIWIMAEDPAQRPVITRPDARQNLLNLGERRPCRYVALQHLELTGGSVLIRYYDCSHIWLDRCELHHAAHGGITINSRDTSHIYVTRNHLHHFLSGTGEGMYLGANHGKVIMRYSVIAKNHVHDCGGEQGDGIELKQGSYNNWLVENHVHDTHYPCLITYGTDGKGINVVERNVCYRSGDNTMQIQGEAIVRNNLIMAAGGAGLASTDHQGQTRNLQLLHNTIINTGVGANLSSWNGRPGMVFADNVVYSRGAAALRFPKGSDRVEVRGNVVLGDVQGCDRGFTQGRGLEDFRSISWDALQRDARPTADSPIARAGINFQE